MSQTREESAALPREQQIATLKEAKGGTWHDDWAPYCMVCTSMARMTERDYGFECRCCRNQIGWDLCRLTDSPLNDAKPAEGGSVSGRMAGLIGAFALPYAARHVNEVLAIMQDAEYAQGLELDAFSRKVLEHYRDSPLNWVGVHGYTEQFANTLSTLLGAGMLDEVDDTDRESGIVITEAGMKALKPKGGMAFDYASLEARVMAQPIHQVIVVGHTGDFPFARRKPGEGLTMSPGMHQLATLIKPPSKTDPWAKGSGGKGKRRPLFRR